MKNRVPSELEALWKEKDFASGKIVDAMVMVMRTNGCTWAKKGGCTMCGYRSASLTNVTAEDLLKQLDQATSMYRGEPFVKIYTSGSFLDEKEIPVNVRDKIFDAFSECNRILFESRPEFITHNTLSTVPSSSTIALGLETHDQEVMEKSIRKGFTPAQCEEAGNIVKDFGLSVRSYLILKPLFVQEMKAIGGTIESARFADSFSDEISINPMNIQSGTVVEYIWKKGDYRPPWLWSLIEVMKQLSGTVHSRIMSSPSGGGSLRGVHNCGACDQSALKAVEKFSFSQNINDLNIECECKTRWKNYMTSELLLGTSADLDREFDSSLMIER